MFSSTGLFKLGYFFNQRDALAPNMFSYGFWLYITVMKKYIFHYIPSWSNWQLNSANSGYSDNTSSHSNHFVYWNLLASITWKSGHKKSTPAYCATSIGHLKQALKLDIDTYDRNLAVHEYASLNSQLDTRIREEAHPKFK